MQLELWMIETLAATLKQPGPSQLLIEQSFPVAWPVLTPFHYDTARKFTGEQTTKVWNFHSIFFFSTFTCENEILIRFHNCFPSRWSLWDCFLSFPISLDNPQSIFSVIDSTLNPPNIWTNPAEPSDMIADEDFFDLIHNDLNFTHNDLLPPDTPPLPNLPLPTLSPIELHYPWPEPPSPPSTIDLYWGINGI